MKIKKSPSRKVFEVFNYTLLTVIMAISLFPLVHMFALSFSSNSAAAAGWVTIFPVDFSLESYKYILEKPEFFRAFGVSILRVILGTSISVSLTILCAYSMSQPDHKFHGRKIYVWMFMITMIFNGGIIPTLLVVKVVGIYNKIWALVLPGAVQTFTNILTTAATISCRGNSSRTACMWQKTPMTRFSELIPKGIFSVRRAL